MADIAIDNIDELTSFGFIPTKVEVEFNGSTHLYEVSVVDGSVRLGFTAPSYADPPMTLVRLFAGSAVIWQ